jgi:hypothetical protein
MSYKLIEDLRILPQGHKTFNGVLTVETDLPEVVQLLAIVETESFKVSQPLNQTQPNVREVTFKFPNHFNEQRVDIHIAVFNANEWVHGPKLNIAVDLRSIQRTNREQDIMKLIGLDLTELRFRLDSYAKGFVKPNLPPYNKEYVKKGMVLMTIDDEGNAAFMFPFYDVIKEVNGVKANDQKLSLSAKNIPYAGDKSVADVLKDLLAAAKQSAENDKKISEALTKIAKSLGELEAKIIQEENRDVI